ncbi:hypothetical protein AAD018_002770 [Aestuariibius insulae]|uniref:hypothetical protein n=1 Tax=Aestuariibius insulae TaxID=2058287 RepID=UPI00345E0E61
MTTTMMMYLAVSGSVLFILAISLYLTGCRMEGCKPGLRPLAAFSASVSYLVVGIGALMLLGVLVPVGGPVGLTLALGVAFVGIGLGYGLALYRLKIILAHD